MPIKNMMIATLCVQLEYDGQEYVNFTISLCSTRREYLTQYRVSALRLAAAAPGSAFVVGTLPTGSAYPAKPRAEVERLGERFSAEHYKMKVMV